LSHASGSPLTQFVRERICVLERNGNSEGRSVVSVAATAAADSAVKNRALLRSITGLLFADFFPSSPT
jgi:hypothetical protein